LPLANRLQSKQVDIASALSRATKAIETPTALRSTAEDGFRKVFSDAAKNGYREYVCELWVAKLTDTLETRFSTM